MILADVILTNPNHMMARDMGMEWIRFCGVLRVSQKFILEERFSKAASSVSQDQVARVLSFCRLPYQTTWVEVSSSFLPSKGKEKRHGVLLQSLNTQSTSFSADFVWGDDRHAFLRPAGAIVDVTPLAASPAKVKRCSFYEAIWNERDNDVSKLARRDYEAEAADVRENLVYWQSVLALINSKNAAEVSAAEKAPPKQNAKTTAAPLSSFSICRLRFDQQTSGQTKESDDHRNIRAHFVRGHFKKRTSGLFWWGPHSRGDMKLGFVQKNYAAGKAPASVGRPA